MGEFPATVLDIASIRVFNGYLRNNQRIMSIETYIRGRASLECRIFVTTDA